jgi:hypothetical protein
MQNNEEIKKKAFEELSKLNQADLETQQEINLEIFVQDLEGSVQRFTVFFERGFHQGKEGWVIRHIISPDELESPADKEKDNIE